MPNSFRGVQLQNVSPFSRIEPMWPARLSRRGFGFIETMIGLILSSLVLGTAWYMLQFGRSATEKTLGPQLSLQMTSREALLEFIKELQESIEIAKPIQGSTLTYFLARDKLNKTMLGYLVKNEKASTREGRELYDFYIARYAYNPTVGATKRKVLSGIERMTFTTLSAGLLEVHADFYEAGHSYAFLTTVRARNIFADSDL